MTKKKERGQLIVLSGPSGVGKSTVIAELLGQRENTYFSVSYTTRQPRVGEQDGVNYNFVTREEFERMIADDELLEYAEYVHNYSVPTPCSSLSSRPPLRSSPAASTGGTRTARRSSLAALRRPARSFRRSRSMTIWSSTTRCPTRWRRSPPF